MLVEFQLLVDYFARGQYLGETRVLRCACMYVYNVKENEQRSFFMRDLWEREQKS